MRQITWLAAISCVFPVLAFAYGPIESGSLEKEMSNGQVASEYAVTCK